jgi:23S rRNA pseudouridine1911/1915/1917 synthase
MGVIVSSQGFEYGVKHFYSPEEAPILHIVSQALNMTPDVLTPLFELGAIYVNNQRMIHSDQIIKYGALIRVHTKPRRYNTDYDWKSLIVFEHEDYIILNKPSGLPSHPSVDNIIENSLTQTERTLEIKLHISHRLDTTTEGLIVYGKKIEFVKAFNNELQRKNIVKKYIALVQADGDKNLPEHLIHYMESTPRAPKKVSPIYHENWDECELKIEHQEKYLSDYTSENVKKIKINLLTGRTHQIRAQLAEIGYPLVGDQMYGSKTKWFKNKKAENQIALKSCFISFNYKDQLCEYELPNNFANSL